MRIPVLVGIVIIAVVVWWSTDPPEDALQDTPTAQTVATGVTERAAETPDAPTASAPLSASSRPPRPQAGRSPLGSRVVRPAAHDAGVEPGDNGAIGVPPHLMGEDAGPEQDDASPEGGDEEELNMIYATTPKGIRSAVQEGAPKIKECYEGWVVANPDLAGRLRVSFTISRETVEDDLAHITRARVQESELGHRLLEGCVLNVMQGLSFEAPEDGEITVTYPFNFESRPPDDDPEP